MNTLLNKVLEQIQQDVAMGDLTAIEELLASVPVDKLIGYLPEELLSCAHD